MKKILFLSTIHSVVRLTFLIIMGLSLCGCSLIGFGLGAVIDSNTPDYHILQDENIVELQPGDEIRILSADSSIIGGIYEKSEPLDSSSYALMYTEFLTRVPEDVVLPKPGDTLTLKTTEYVFHGFKTGALNVERLSTQTQTNLPFYILSIIERSDGTLFDYNEFERIRSEGLLPLNESIVVKSMGETLSVTLNHIKYIERRSAKNRKWIMGGIGLAVDIGVIIAIIIRGGIVGDFKPFSSSDWSFN